MSQERQNTTGNPGGSYSDGPGQASPHVNFSSRSPSILPTPIYDDSSTVMSSPAPLHISSPLVNATPPQTFDPAPISIPFSPQNIHPPPSDPDHFSKIQVEDDYGPTFQQEVEKPGHANLLSRLRGNQGFVPLKDNDEEDRFFYNPESSENRFAPPPEQNRANTFMNNLKGDPENNPYDEKANEQQQRGMYNEHNPAYGMPKNRGALYGLVLGPTPFPFFTWGTAFAMLGVFIFELIRNSALTGNWIQTNPINPMIGPSSLVSFFFSYCMFCCLNHDARYLSISAAFFLRV